ncbi:ATP-binding cassette domain-containing protein, partial [bacterium]|nr:ATP-binding cassette domain-containing protein [bacterium]
RLEGIRKSYGSLRVIEDLSLEIERGRKIAFVGPNGAGKSTLMRIVAGVDEGFAGAVTLGSGVEIGYFAQESAEAMSSERTVEEEAETVCPFDLSPKLRNLLGAFLFRGDDVEKPVSVLSGGERSRLALLKMLLHPANLLILDEPTNHLDLTSKDVLLEALRSFEGTVLFVSHDRGFIAELADMVLELEAGTTPRLYYGDYAYYLEKKAALEAAAAAAETGELPPAGAPASPRPQVQPPSPAAGAPLSPPSWEEEKQRKAQYRKLKKREEDILARLEAISRGKKALEDDMALPANYSDGAKAKKIMASIAALESEAAALNDEWVEAADALSAFDQGSAQ